MNPMDCPFARRVEFEKELQRSMTDQEASESGSDSQVM